MDKISERKLVLAAKSDPKAFTKLYDHYYPLIFKFALRRTADIEIAQDVTSETFYKVLKNLWQFRFRSVPFSSWIYKIANNEINNYYRKHKMITISIETSFIEPESNQNITQEFIEAEDKLLKLKEFKKMQQEISELDTKYQEVLALRFFENKKYSEIAQILGKSEGTIKSLVSRGLKLLRKKRLQPNQDSNVLLNKEIQNE